MLKKLKTILPFPTVLSALLGMFISASIFICTATAQTINSVENASMIEPSVLLLPDSVPLPKARPHIQKSKPKTAPVMENIAVQKRYQKKLQTGLEALKRGKVNEAKSIAALMPKASLENHILWWAIAISGRRHITSLEIAEASAHLKGWPGSKLLRRNSELALARANAKPENIVRAFGKTTPETTSGAIAFTRALIKTNNKKAASRVISKVWRTQKLSKRTDKKIIKEFSNLLSRQDHLHRMHLLLYRDRVKQAKPISRLANAHSLYKARSSALNKRKSTSKDIASVHKMWRNDPGLLFAKVEYLRRKKKYKSAAHLLLKSKFDQKNLINPHEWWVERRIISRGLLDQKEYMLAYKIAAGHQAKRSSDIIEAEFHAGWYALRFMRAPKRALKHFKRAINVSKRPLSISRSNYWYGRALEATGDKSASLYYENAAAYPATYYGQLASRKIGQQRISIAYPKPDDDARAKFSSRMGVKVMKFLTSIGQDRLARFFYFQLARNLSSPQELALLTAHAEKQNNYRLSLQIGKISYGRGLDVAALAFPVGVIPANTKLKTTGRALAYSIARQESAFDPTARSQANAVGLMQLLPGTARGVARRHGYKYSKKKLTSEAGYNATLGAIYLDEQIKKFKGSYILTFIAYNAGPRRASQWIKRFGDPRGKSLNYVIDWVEKIPFTETRNYVQRVLENYQVYKTRLGGQANLAHDLQYGRNNR